jgi:hypothetical protein
LLYFLENTKDENNLTPGYNSSKKHKEGSSRKSSVSNNSKSSRQSKRSEKSKQSKQSNQFKQTKQPNQTKQPDDNFEDEYMSGEKPEEESFEDGSMSDDGKYSKVPYYLFYIPLNFTSHPFSI